MLRAYSAHIENNKWPPRKSSFDYVVHVEQEFGHHPSCLVLSLEAARGKLTLT